jgi:hypothetical protein
MADASEFLSMERQVAEAGVLGVDEVDILKAKRADGAAETAGLEREIDERVYRLYSLTAEEVKIVEEAEK